MCCRHWKLIATCQVHWASFSRPICNLQVFASKLQLARKQVFELAWYAKFVYQVTSLSISQQQIWLLALIPRQTPAQNHSVSYSATAHTKHSSVSLPYFREITGWLVCTHGSTFSILPSPVHHWVINAFSSYHLSPHLAKFSSVLVPPGLLPSTSNSVHLFTQSSSLSSWKIQTTSTYFCILHLLLPLATPHQKIHWILSRFIGNIAIQNYVLRYLEFARFCRCRYPIRSSRKL
jgi:hypothetical protein